MWRELVKKSKEFQNKDDGFFDSPKVIRWLLRIFYSICIALVAVDFIIHRHTSTDIEKIPAFYAIYGFIVCAILVLAARQLRKLLIREEYYYSDVAKLSKKDNKQ